MASTVPATSTVRSAPFNNSIGYKIYSSKNYNKTTKVEAIRNMMCHALTFHRKECNQPLNHGKCPIHGDKITNKSLINK